MNTQCMFSEAIRTVHTVITLSCQPETNYPNRRILYTVMSIHCMVCYVCAKNSPIYDYIKPWSYIRRNWAKYMFNAYAMCKL